MKFNRHLFYARWVQYPYYLVKFTIAKAVRKACN